MLIKVLSKILSTLTIGRAKEERWVDKLVPLEDRFVGADSRSRGRGSREDGASEELDFGSRDPRAQVEEGRRESRSRQDASWKSAGRSESFAWKQNEEKVSKLEQF